MVVVSPTEGIGYVYRTPRANFALERIDHTFQMYSRQKSPLRLDTATLLTYSTGSVRSVPTKRLGKPFCGAREEFGEPGSRRRIDLADLQSSALRNIVASHAFISHILNQRQTPSIMHILHLFGHHQWYGLVDQRISI